MAGVNPTLARQLLDRIRALRDEDRLTFLLIDHDLDVVMSVSDRVIVMSEGRVIATGTPDEVRANPVVDAYLGTHGRARREHPGAPVLTALDLSAGYGELKILGVSVVVPHGGFVSVIGPNGAGKSTLLKAIYGLADRRAGSVSLHVDGDDVELARLHPMS